LTSGVWINNPVQLVPVSGSQDVPLFTAAAGPSSNLVSGSVSYQGQSGMFILLLLFFIFTLFYFVCDSLVRFWKNHIIFYSQCK
jgi:hypothetical protein